VQRRGGIAAWRQQRHADGDSARRGVALGLGRDAHERERAVVVEKVVRQLVWSAELLWEAGLPAQIVSCGGTGTEEVSSRIPGVTEVQAGGIIFNDVRYAGLGTETEALLQ
jgi:D-serine deaminase-like pyridoxal phosphate-dependent protein